MFIALFSFGRRIQTAVTVGLHIAAYAVYCARWRLAFKSTRTPALNCEELTNLLCAFQGFLFKKIIPSMKPDAYIVELQDGRRYDSSFNFFLYQSADLYSYYEI